jgi:mRNA (guanine-N7-)-methyltransferase
MLRNVSECLKPGGYFIGTTPDAYDIVHRARETGTNCAGNSIYSVTFRDKEALDKIPLFGARYDFHLEGVVDCPEFLVHFPTLTKLAEKYGLMLVAKRRFANYFHQFKDSEKNLLSRMNALEAYPPHENVELVGSDVADNYAGAESFLSGAQDESGQGHGRSRVGTLSREEWEAATLYIIFAFKKINL